MTFHVWTSGRGVVFQRWSIVFNLLGLPERKTRVVTAVLSALKNCRNTNYSFEEELITPPNLAVEIRRSLVMTIYIYFWCEY